MSKIPVEEAIGQRPLVAIGGIKLEQPPIFAAGADSSRRVTRNANADPYSLLARVLGTNAEAA